MVKERVLMMVAVFFTDEKVLLGLKKRGFGEGRWNGYGGKVKVGESLNAATRREVFEEAGILVGGLEEFGVIDFEFVDEPNKILEVHFIRILNFYGTPRETEEMRPRWFLHDDIPYDKMWPADKYLLPLLLEEKKFSGSILFKNPDEVLTKNIVLA